MKYIRTEQEIYDMNDLFIIKNKLGTSYGVKGSSWVIYPESISNYANTIQDLCDAFVVVDGNQVAELHNFKLAKNTKGEVYGVIYVVDEVGNEEPKTVAKMNEKGELELL